MPTQIQRADVNVYWSFDGVFLADSSGKGNTLTNLGGVAVGSGLIGNGAVFTAGNETYFSRANNSYVSPSGSWAVSVWFRASAAQGGSGTLLNTVPDPNNENGFKFRATGVNGQAVNLWMYPDSTTHTSTSVTSGNNIWQLAVFSYDATTQQLTFRLNNGPRETFSVVSPGFLIGTAPLTIGFDYAGGQGYFTGDMDEIAIYDHALTSDEEDWLYNGGDGRTWEDYAVPVAPSPAANPDSLVGSVGAKGGYLIAPEYASPTKRRRSSEPKNLSLFDLVKKQQQDQEEEDELLELITLIDTLENPL